MLRSGVLTPRTPGGRPASWAATGRSGGCSDRPYDRLNLAGHVGDDPARVLDNREALRREVGAAGLAVLRAVHGAQVVEATAPGDLPEADAVITRAPDLGVLALGADCVVLGMVGDDDRTVAAVHCGWRGLVNDVIGATIDALGDRGVRPRAVIMGPAICGSCYPVPDERADEVRDLCSSDVAAAALVRTPDGQPGIDVRRGLRVRLAELGVADEQVVCLPGCTAEDPGLFSHRRDGRTGRQGLVVVSHGPIAGS